MMEWLPERLLQDFHNNLVCCMVGSKLYTSCLHKSCTNSAKDKIIIKILPQSCRQSFHHCTLFNWHDYINSRRCRCTQVIMRVHTSFYFQGWCLAQINSKYKNTVSISKNVTHLKILKSMFHKKILEKGVDPKKIVKDCPIFWCVLAWNIWAVLCNFFGWITFSSIFL